MRFAALIMLLTLAAGMPWGTLAHAQAPELTAEQLLQQADQALKKEDHVAAAQALETYLAKKPDDYRAEFNLAYSYSLTGRRADAISRYRNVLQRQPDLLPAHLNLGILLLEEKNAGEAEGHLRAVLQQQPDNPAANSRLAEALVLLKRFPEAGEVYEKVLKLQPNDARSHFTYAKIIIESNPAVAEEHLRHAVRLDPALEEAWMVLAELLESQGAQNPDKLREAAEIYLQVLQKNPKQGEVRMRLGVMYANRDQFAAAAEQFEIARASGDKSLPLAKQLLQAYANLSAAREAARKPAGQRVRLEDRLNNPGEPNAVEPGNRASSNQAPSGNPNDIGNLEEKMFALVQEVLTQEPGNAELHLLNGRLYLERKEYRNAAEAFYRAAQLQPQSAEAFTNLASAFYLQGEIEATVGALAKVSALQKDTAGTYFLRAICLDKLQQFRPALENYRRFLALADGKNPDQEFQARQRSRIIELNIRKGIGGRK